MILQVPALLKLEKARLTTTGPYYIIVGHKSYDGQE